MSRTFKDKPWKFVEAEALAHGFTCRTLSGREYGDGERWLRSRHNVRIHQPVDGMHDYRWYECEWHPDYGSRRRVREELADAARHHNSGFDDDDWDGAAAYHRRRAWSDR